MREAFLTPGGSPGFTKRDRFLSVTPGYRPGLARLVTLND
jgi:hypothetical protein